MEKIRLSRRPRAQIPGLPPLGPALTKTRPPWARGRMKVGVGAREERGERTRWAGITGVSEIPPSAPVLCRAGQREHRGNKMTAHFPLWMGSRGLDTRPLYSLFPLPGSLIPLTAFLSTMASIAHAGYALFPCPALLFFVATGYYVALCYVPVVCPTPPLLECKLHEDRDFVVFTTVRMASTY